MRYYTYSFNKQYEITLNINFKNIYKSANNANSKKKFKRNIYNKKASYEYDHDDDDDEDDDKYLG